MLVLTLCWPDGPKVLSVKCLKEVCRSSEAGQQCLCLFVGFLQGMIQAGSRLIQETGAVSGDYCGVNKGDLTVDWAELREIHEDRHSLNVTAVSTPG